MPQYKSAITVVVEAVHLGSYSEKRPHQFNVSLPSGPHQGCRVTVQLDGVDVSFSRRQEQHRHGITVVFDSIRQGHVTVIVRDVHVGAMFYQSL